MSQIEVCRSKRRYETRKIAKTWARRMVGRGFEKQWEYKCPICNDWHLTSKKKGWLPHD